MRTTLVRNDWKQAAAVLLGMLVVTCTARQGKKEETGVFPSPSGRHMVGVRFLQDVKATDPTNTEQIDFAIYELLFVSADNAPLAQTRFHDVYGWDGERTLPSAFVGYFTWSPGEDFVILPVEGWMTAPGTVSARAINLNPQHRWTEAEIALDDLVWLDSLRVAGNRMSDCEYAVEYFDGRRGETRSIMAAHSPLGFQIALVDDTSLVVESQMDNCASEEQRENHKRECVSVSRRTLEAHRRECPR